MQETLTKIFDHAKGYAREASHIAYLFVTRQWFGMAVGSAITFTLTEVF